MEQRGKPQAAASRARGFLWAPALPLLPLLLLIALVPAVDGRGISDVPRSDPEANRQWEMCTRVCKAVGVNRVAMENAAGSFTVQCWRSDKANGVLRIMDYRGVTLVAYQPCKYGP